MSSMAGTIYLKRNDTKAVLSDTLTVNGVPVDLTGSNVFCNFAKVISRMFGGVQVATGLQRAAVINGPPANGNVRYQPDPADFADGDEFQQEWEVVFPDNERLTFPNGGYNVIMVLPDLA